MQRALFLLRAVVEAVAVAVVMLIATTTAQALASVDPCVQSVCFQGAVVSGDRVRPPALFLTRDGGLQVINVTWSTWGSEIARGTGAAVYETVGAGAHISIRVIRVSVTLSQTVACDPSHDVPNGLYYNRVRLTNRRTHKLVAGDYLRSLQWAPCESA
jgi:hypothetical protein